MMFSKDVKSYCIMFSKDTRVESYCILPKDVCVNLNYVKAKERIKWLLE
jgi:hypothetical protein